MGRMATAKRLFLRILPFLELLGLLILVILALIFPQQIDITWPIVALIVLILIVPYIPYISRIRYGEIEAEFDLPDREDEIVNFGPQAQITDEGESL